MSFVISDVGLVVTDTPGADEWRDFGASLLGQLSSLQWAIGDWLLYGDMTYSVDSETATRITGLKRGTLWNLKSVARAYQHHERVSRLFWSHHALAQGVEPVTRAALLARSLAEGWTWYEMRDHVSAVRRDKPHHGGMAAGGWRKISCYVPQHIAIALHLLAARNDGESVGKVASDLLYEALANRPDVFAAARQSNVPPPLARSLN